MLRLEDFFSDVPLVEDDEFSLKLAEQGQYAELGSESTERRPNPGFKYNHQAFAALYFQTYNEALIVHEPGTGKTCLAAAVAEALKIHFLEPLDNGISPKIKKVIVLNRGDILADNFKHEIVCRCLPGQYYDEKNNIGVNLTNQKKRVNKALAQYFTFINYPDGIFGLFGDLSDEFIIENYANTLFIIDEGHNLVSVEDTNNDDETKSLKKIDRAYTLLKKSLQIIPGRKVLILTGTPFRHVPDELRRLMNIILPADEEVKGKKIEGSIKFEKMTEEDIWYMCRGRISYLREMERDINITYPDSELIDDILGEDLGGKTRIFECEMTGIQLEAYEGVYAEKGMGSFQRPHQQASNFVFPDGSYGAEGYKSYVNPTPKKVKGEIIARTMFPSFNNRFITEFYHGKRPSPENTLEYIRDHGCKYYEMLKYVSENETKKCIIYQSLKLGSGAYVLALLFEKMGYEILTNDMMAPQRGTAGYCDSQQVKMNKKKRIGVLATGDELSDANRQFLINSFNSPENVLGEYIQCIIFTPFAREGLSFNNVQAIFIDPTWSPSVGEQAKRRGLRSNSHQDLKDNLEEIIENNPDLQEEIEMTIQEQVDLGVGEEDEIRRKLTMINVEVFQLAATAPNNDPPSGDLKIFRDAAAKQMVLDKYYLMLKQMCLNCFIDRNRNQQNDSIGEQYDCQVGPDSFINPMTYDYNIKYDYFWLNPSEETIELIISYLKGKFLNFPIIFLEDLYYAIAEKKAAAKFKKYKEDDIQRILTEPFKNLVHSSLSFIAGNQTIFENWYGKRNFIAMSEDSIAIIGKIDDQYNTWYQNNIIKFVAPLDNWKDIIKDKIIAENSVALNVYFNEKEYHDRKTRIILGEDYMRISSANISKLPTGERNYLLEASFLPENYDKPFAKGMRYRYRGRYFENEEGEIVSFFLGAKDTRETRYSYIEKFLRPKEFRIFDGTKWRDADTTENKEYAIQQENTARELISSFNEDDDIADGIYGYYVLDDEDAKLYIADARTIDFNPKSRKEGIACNTQNLETKAIWFNRTRVDIYETFEDQFLIDKYADIPLENKISYLKRSHLDTDYEDEKLVDYYYTFFKYHDDKKVTNDCKTLGEHLKNLDRIIYY